MYMEVNVAGRSEKCQLKMRGCEEEQGNVDAREKRERSGDTEIEIEENKLLTRIRTVTKSRSGGDSPLESVRPDRRIGHTSD